MSKKKRPFDKDVVSARKTRGVYYYTTTIRIGNGGMLSTVYPSEKINTTAFRSFQRENIRRPTRQPSNYLSVFLKCTRSVYTRECVPRVSMELPLVVPVRSYLKTKKDRTAPSECFAVLQSLLYDYMGSVRTRYFYQMAL